MVRVGGTGDKADARWVGGLMREDEGCLDGQAGYVGQGRGWSRLVLQGLGAIEASACCSPRCAEGS